MRRPSAVFIPFVLALAVAAPAAPEEPATQPAGGSSVAMTGAEANRLAAELAPAVEEIRGLKFKRPVPVKVVDDAAARAHFQTRIAKFWPEARLRAEQDVYIDLGLLPPGTDLLDLLFDLLEEQAGGYYDPDSDTFFVLDDMPRSSAPILIVHELTHALDDQHYGIDTLIDPVRTDEDREAALNAVVEGSGSAVMTAFILREMGAGRLSLDTLQEIQKTEAGRAEKVKAAPELLKRALLGPYVLGQAFLFRGSILGAMAGVKPADLDRAFREPPRSTEQILHPEKYWDAGKQDPPRPVGLPDLSQVLGAGWWLAAEGTFGEMGAAILTAREGLDLDSAAIALASGWSNEAAAGWGGDRWQHYRSAERRATLLATRWDTEADAGEFERAVGGRERLTVARQGDAVVIVAGDAGDRAAAVAAVALGVLLPTPPAPAAAAGD